MVQRADTGGGPESGTESGTEGAPFLPKTMWRDWLLPALSADVRNRGGYAGQLRHDVLNREGATLHGPFAYMAGHGGQRVYLLPEQDTVVVRFGAAPQLLHSTLYELFPVQQEQTPASATRGFN